MNLIECEERKDALYEELNSLDTYAAEGSSKIALLYLEIRKNCVEILKIEEEEQNDNAWFWLEESLRRRR